VWGAAQHPAAQHPGTGHPSTEVWAVRRQWLSPVSYCTSVRRSATGIAPCPTVQPNMSSASGQPQVLGLNDDEREKAARLIQV